ncbi:MAG: DUF58 domain-containing protein [Actinomycetes bacterium]
MKRRSRLRLTPAGTAVLVGSILLAAIGLVSGYREFAVVAAAGVVVLLIAVVLPRVTSAIEFERQDVPHFVARGSVVAVALHTRVEHTAPPTRIIDQLAGLAVPIDLPQLSPDRDTVARYRIQALQRGVHHLGPLLEERSDPFALATRTVRHDVIDEVLVHPYVHRLRLPDSGSRMRQARAIVPRFSEDPLADFRSLREYVVGDDSRLVHWASTAKTGTLMVRDHVELRRTTRTVVLETLDRSANDALFEDAVELAASIVCESLEQELQVVMRTRDRENPGRLAFVRHRQEALELFTRVQRTTPDDTLPAAQLRLQGDSGDQIFLVTGADSPLVTELAGNVLIARRLVVVRLHDGSTPLRRLPVRHIDVTSAEQFVARWNQRPGNL